MFKTKYSKRSIATTIFVNAIIVMTFYCITNTFTSLFDGYIVSQYIGDVGTSAIRLTKTLNQLIMCVAQLFGLGCQIIATKYMAEGEKGKAKSVFNMVFFFALFVSLGILVINLTTAKWLPIALSGGQASKEVLESCSYYLFSYSIGIPFLILSQILNPIVYLDGNHKISKITIGVTIVVNCLVSVLTAKFAANKIFYMGLSSTLAAFSGFACYMTHFISKKYTFKLKFNKIVWSDFKEVLKQGSTMALKLLAITVKLYLFTIIIYAVGNKAGEGYGDIINTARGAQETISGFFETPLGGLMLTIIMINSVYYSEHNDSQFKNLIKLVFKFYLIVCVTIAIAYFFAAKSIATVYLPKGSKSLDLCIYGMRCGALTILFLPFNTTTLGVFQSSRKVLRAYITTLIQSFVLPVGCMAIFGFAFGPYGIFTGYLVNTMLFIPIYIIYTVIRNKGWPRTLNKFFLLEKDYGFKDKCKLDMNIHSIEDINKLNEQIIHFCKVNKLNHKLQNKLLACSYELLDIVSNKYYMRNNKKVMIYIRLTCKDNELKFTVMDNLKLHSLSELSKTASQKLNKTTKFFKDCDANFNHSNMLKMNCLTLNINKDDAISAVQSQRIYKVLIQQNII